MNVLHLHTTDKSGGGAKLVSLLNRELDARNGIESTLLVGEQETDAENVEELGRLPLESTFTLGLERVLSLNGLGSPSSVRFQRYVRNHDIDVLHLHNLHGRYFNFLNIRALPDDLPLLWTIHDMWPLTGHCSYSLDCDRYTDGCGSCPHLGTYPPIAVDTTRLLHRLKQWAFDRSRLSIITPSVWMREKVDRSYLSGHPCRHIPHGIDTEFYAPVESAAARERLGLPSDGFVVMFIANGTTQPRKGVGYLLEALHQLNDGLKARMNLLAVGGRDFPAAELDDAYGLTLPGYVPDEELPVAYSAADICVVPSRYESFGLVATEAMSCGTPVVAFDTSGLGEQITTETGWLCEPENAGDLAASIEAALADREQLRRKGAAAREHVLAEYGLSRFVDNYVDMYRRLLDTGDL